MLTVMLTTIKHKLRSDKAEASYISTMVSIFVAVVIMAFIINLFSVISTKRQLDHAVDQIVKQIQLAGGINADTNALFAYLRAGINGAENVIYTVDATYRSPRPLGMTNAIQLGSPFYVTIQGQVNLGGFWRLRLTRITIVARGAGISEKYWK